MIQLREQIFRTRPTPGTIYISMPEPRGGGSDTKAPHVWVFRPQAGYNLIVLTPAAYVYPVALIDNK